MDTKTLFEIIRSGIDFRLTGSRYFDTDTPESDWDFFTQYTLSTEDWLRANNFSLESYPARDYTDRSIHSIWGKDNVHIQLVKNVDEKDRANVLLFHSEVFKALVGLSRPERKLIWNLVLACLRNADHPALSEMPRELQQEIIITAKVYYGSSMMLPYNPSSRKIHTIKHLRSLFNGIRLIEAKHLVDYAIEQGNRPSWLKE